MPLKFHADRSEKIRQQYLTSKEYIVDFVSGQFSISDKKILEIGCGEGGILQAFWEEGAICTGIDLEIEKIEYANDHYLNEINQGKVSFEWGNVYDLVHKYRSQFDLVILKDTIEHIPQKEKLLSVLPMFLRDKDGLIFVGFPPWQNPFGGHQQMCDTKIKYIPWIHLLPRKLYEAGLTLCGERLDRIEGLMDVVDTRLSMERFESLAFQTSLEIIDKRFYLINPIYKYKFNLQPVVQSELIARIPYLRDFLTTTCYYLIRKSS
jgi:hypothetical protein